VEKGEITRGDCGHGGRKDRLFLLLSQINHLRASEAKHRQPLFGGCMDECNLRQTKQKKTKRRFPFSFFSSSLPSLPCSNTLFHMLIHIYSAPNVDCWFFFLFSFHILSACGARWWSSLMSKV
jgi:hypothetical protein